MQTAEHAVNMIFEKKKNITRVANHKQQKLIQIGEKMWNREFEILGLQAPLTKKNFNTVCRLFIF